MTLVTDNCSFEYVFMYSLHLCFIAVFVFNQHYNNYSLYVAFFNPLQVFDSPHLKVMVGKGVRRRLDAKSIVQLLQSFEVPVGNLQQ